MVDIQGSYINGDWYTQHDAPIYNVVSPANTADIVGKVSWVVKAGVDLALCSADRAYSLWHDTKFSHRKKLIKKLLKSLEEKQQELAKTITSENGKTFNEALAEVRAGIAESRFQLDFISKNHRIKTKHTSIEYHPLGLALVITPWNFPLATILRKLIPALLTGNPTIVKPSELTPLTAIELFKIIDEIGFPAGVAQMVIGDGDSVSGLIESHLVKAISFTGSNQTGQLILTKLSGRDIRFQAEMGGSNVVVVLDDARLELAVKDILNSGFSCCGQWCTGTSRVIAEKGVHDQLVEMLKHRASEISFGDGMNSDNAMGPLSNQRQYDRVSSKINMLLEQGSKLEFGGVLNENERMDGFFIRPTVFSRVTMNMKSAKEEIFGPVLMVIKAQDADHAIQLANDSTYGLSASIYTESKVQATRFIRKIEAGMVHINLPTSFREYNMPLMGWKDSGFGIPECGRFMLDLFTKPKVIYRA